MFSGALVVSTASAHPGPVVPPAFAPDQGLSTSGDYATDVLGDPWDFSNDDDVPPYPLVGCEPSIRQTSAANACDLVRSPDGVLTVSTHAGTTIKLIRNWDLQLPWGHDGQVHPVDAGRYSRLSMSMCIDGSQLNMGIRFYNEAGGYNQIPIVGRPGCNQYSYDLTAGPYAYPQGFPAGVPWAAKITRLELISGGPTSGGNPAVNVSLDWVRLHRPDAPEAPPAGLAIAKVINPSLEGGNDYATDNGNPWDFTGPNDVLDLHDIADASFANGVLSGRIEGNDSYVELPLPSNFNPDRYHRLTAQLCYDGAMDFADIRGGGMEVRIAWFGDGGYWVESQTIVPQPGCNRISLDLATDPTVAVNDENTISKNGWRGQRITRLRIDISEDRGGRNFTLSQLKFAEDAAFSDSYPIQIKNDSDAGGVSADVYVTTNRGATDGTLIATRVGVGPRGTATVNWNGTNLSGGQMPNGSYWVYTVMRNTAGVAVGYSSGPLRLQRPLPPTPSQFVPLSPYRLLDTRDGTGGNITPLGPDVTTELQIAGRGGVPATGATAVVMNVTAAIPTASSVLTVWPSGEDRPLVSSLNYVPGQVVANLVTVKVGANGKVNLHNLFGQVNVVADVVGYYAATNSNGRFTPLTPDRVLDTGFDAKITPGGTIDVPVTGAHGVPAAGVSGVALNITVDDPSAAGFLTVYPTGEGRPNASTVNFVPGLTVANLVLAKVGAGGKVSIWNYDGTARVVVDVVGYFSAQGGQFVPVSPLRLIDTRDGTGVARGQIPGGSAITAVLVRPGSPIPGNATGAVLNVTSAEVSQQTVFTVYPTGVPKPSASTLNPRPGVPVPNHTYAKLGSGGSVDVANYIGTADAIIDVFGYIVP